MPKYEYLGGRGRLRLEIFLRAFYYLNLQKNRRRRKNKGKKTFIQSTRVSSSVRMKLFYIKYRPVLYYKSKEQ